MNTPNSIIALASILSAAVLAASCSCSKKHIPDLEASVTFSATGDGSCTPDAHGGWQCSVPLGGELTLSLTTNAGTFTLDSWSDRIACEGVSPSVSEGAAFSTESGKPWTVRWTGLHGGDHTLSFTVLDPRSSQTKSFCATVSVWSPFKLSATLTPSLILSGGDVTLRVFTDAPTLKLAESEWAYNEFAATDADVLKAGREYSFTQTDRASGLLYRDFLFKGLSVTADDEGGLLKTVWVNPAGSQSRSVGANVSYKAYKPLEVSAVLGMPAGGLRGRDIQDGVIERGELAAIEIRCSRPSCVVSKLQSSTGAVWFTSPATKGTGTLADGQTLGFSGEGGSVAFETVLKDGDVPAGGPEGYAGTLAFTLTDPVSGGSRDVELRYTAKDHVPVAPLYLHTDNPTVQGQSIGADAQGLNPWLNCAQVYGVDLRTLPFECNGGVTVSLDPTSTAALQYAFTEQGTPCDWSKVSEAEFRTLTGEAGIGKATCDGNVQGLWLRATDHAGQAVLNISTNIPGTGGQKVSKTIRLRVTQRLAIVYDGYCENETFKYVFKDYTEGSSDYDGRIINPGVSEYFPPEKGPFGWYGLPLQSSLCCTYGHDDGEPAIDDPFEGVRMTGDGVPVRDLGDIALHPFKFPEEDVGKPFSMDVSIRMDGAKSDYRYFFYHSEKGWPYRLLLWNDGKTGLDRAESPFYPGVTSQQSGSYTGKLKNGTNFGSLAVADGVMQRLSQFTDCYRYMKEDGECVEHLRSDIHIMLSYSKPVMPEGYELKYVVFANGLMKGGRRFHIPGHYSESYHIEQYDDIFPYYYTDPKFNWLYPLGAK